MLTLINTIVFGALFLIWQRNDWINLLIKMILFGLMVANLAVYVR